MQFRLNFNKIQFIKDYKIIFISFFTVPIQPRKNFMKSLSNERKLLQLFSFGFLAAMNKISQKAD